MAGTAVQRRLNWLIAEVVEVIEETPRVRSLVLDCPGWIGHRPGQHIDLRLTAPDGYQAQRSYSIATPADGNLVTITVERVDDGEVSPYLIEDVLVGDRLELRGPIGGYFVWVPGGGDPVQLVAGGSGVVPLMAMMRARVGAGATEPMRLLLSARSLEDVIYREELERLASDENGIEVTVTLTRSHPPGWSGLTRRVDQAMLDEKAWGIDSRPLHYICGPTGFVEAVASTLVEIGHNPERIKTERFGPTGG